MTTTTTPDRTVDTSFDADTASISGSTLAPAISIASSSAETLTATKPTLLPIELPAEPFLSRSLLPHRPTSTSQRLQSLGYPASIADECAAAAGGEPNRASILAYHAAHVASGEGPRRMCPRCVEISRGAPAKEEKKDKKPGLFTIFAATDIVWASNIVGGKTGRAGGYGYEPEK